MVRHRRDDLYFEPAAEVDPADRLEQHHPTDPVEATADAEQAAFAAPLSGETDPVDATEQAEPIALDEELRAKPLDSSASPPETSE